MSIDKYQLRKALNHTRPQNYVSRGRGDIHGGDNDFYWFKQMFQLIGNKLQLNQPGITTHHAIVSLDCVWLTVPY